MTDPVAAPVAPATPAPAVPATPVPPPADPAAPAAPGIPQAPNVLEPSAADPAATPAAEPVALKPEDYTLPEGIDKLGISREDPMVAGYLTKAAELGLPQDKVAALLETVAPELQAQLMKPYQAFVDLQKTWADEIKADPVFGGAKLPETVTSIRNVLKTMVATPGMTPDAVNAEMAKLDDALRITGAGNNPAVFRVLANMASRLAEGNPVAGNPGGNAGAQLSPAQKLFNHPTSNGGVSAPR